MAAAALGILIAASVAAGGPIYLRSLELLGAGDTVRRIAFGSDIQVNTRWMVLDQEVFDQSTANVAAASRDHLRGLATGTSNAVRSSAHYWGHIEQGLQTGGIDSRAYHQRLTDLPANVRYVDGRPPGPDILFDDDGPVVEAAVYGPRAEVLGVRAGDVLDTSAVAHPEGHVRAVITGVFTERDRRAPYWGGLAGLFLEPEPLVDGQLPPLALFLDGDAIFHGVGAESPGLPAQAWWFIGMDRDQIGRLSPGHVIDMMRNFETAVSLGVPRSSTLSSLSPSFTAFQQRLLFARVPMFLIAALAIAVSGYYLFMVAGIMAQRRQAEVAMLRSRGISVPQIVGVYARESSLLIWAPSLAAPLLAAVVISQLGRLPAYSSVTGGNPLPVEMSWLHFAYAIGVGLIAFAIFTLPTLARAASRAVAERPARSGPDRPPFFQRYYLDAGLLVLGGLVWWELNSRGSAVSAGLDGAQQMNVTVLFAPVLFLVAAALIFLRLFPLALNGGAWVGRRAGGPWFTLAFWRLSRSPFQYSWPILLLVLASGLAIIAGTVAATLQRSSDERIAYRTAADMRVTVDGQFASLDAAAMERLGSIDGVTATASALRTRGVIGTTGLGPQFTLLAVDSPRFLEVSWFRDDFAPAPLADLMEAIIVADRPEPLLLPLGAREIGIWTRADPAVDNLFFWVALRGANNRINTVTLGPIHGEWRYQSAQMPSMVEPIELLSLQVFQPVGDDGGSRSTLLIDDLQVVRADAAGNEVVEVVVDFEELGPWVGMPTSEGLDVTFDLAPEPRLADGGIIGAHEGQTVGRLRLGRGTDSGVRGIYRSPAQGPIPVIASERFMSQARVGMHEPFVVSLAGRFTPIEIVEVVEYFPTLAPGGNGFVVADLQALREYLDVRGFRASAANEAYISLEPGRHGEVAAAVRSMTRVSSLETRQDLAQGSLLDPLAVAGWRGMGLIATGLTGVVAILGYGTYLLAYAHSTRTESGFLRALGLSRSHFLRMMALEHLLVVALGVALGIGAGLLASRLAVESVAFTETGGQLIPPLVLVTQWGAVSLLVAALSIFALLMLALLVRSFARRSLHMLARGEE